MGDIAEFSKGSGYSKGDLIESGTPIILYGRLYTKYETSISEVDTYVEAKDGSVYSKGGEVIVPASGETAEDIARAATVDKSGVILGGDLNVVSPNEDINSAFLAISISHGNSQRELAKKAQGKSIVHIHNEEIKNLVVPFPTKAEQNKIVEYFSSLDNLITLHQRKCEETKKLKKYMLQKMFPQNGKRVPEIRFVGFTEDWEQRKVKEFAIESEVKGHSGKDAKKLTVKLHNKGVYVADEKIQGSDNTQYYIRRAGQFIYGKQNFFNGAIGIVPKKLDKYESTKDVPAFDVSSDVNVDWLYYYIARPEIYKPQEALCTGTGSKRFHVNNFYNLSLAIPKMDEQIKIKEYFVHLDNLITLHQRKYEELQKIKKFMLQNMFI